MRLKLLFDMNLPPDFAAYFSQQGVSAVHWATVGNPDATDVEIMDFAKKHGYVVVTLDLDFSAILAATQGSRPSVVQIRAKAAIFREVFDLSFAAIERAGQDLLAGAILTIDTEKSRLRVLPLLR
jgi:predicted nuclease of predicted toxin-antitoxin system